MKGGITSGLVYPKAVVRFARDYQVRNVGGTSIGAIAAALTAGAEYQRQSQADPHSYWSGELDQALAQDLAAESDSGNMTSLSTNTGFSGLYTIPNDIGGDLLGKFQPEPETKPLFGYLMRLMTYGSKPGKVVAATFLGLWIPRIVAVLLGVLLFGAIRVLDPTAEGRAALAAGAVVAIAVIAIARKFRPDAMPP
ncbi:MAG: patatin-like phospholipase family protein, partial [Chloroflexota bacterium]|nr:patatin-like phospholipase family protein [Chloroflexota bacterium]